MDKGLIVNIYKNDSRSYSNNGLSSNYDRALLIGDDIDEIFESEDLPRIKLMKGTFDGTVIAVPLEQPIGKIGPMFGGTFISTSDARVTRAIRKITGNRFYGAVPLHDRFE